jgi:lysine 2,3-aminomutase
VNPKTPVVIRKLEQLDGLGSDERERLAEVTEQFTFRVSPYYSELVNWADPDDPLRKIVLPAEDELDSELEFDASDEAENTKVPGLQHKYRQTALLLVNDFCAAYCRFCFRKRFTLSSGKDAHITVDDAEKETSFNVAPGIEYIKNHPEISTVLLTGGDPLMLAPSRLKRIIDDVRAIPHVGIIRIGTKVPPFDPDRMNEEMFDVLTSTQDGGPQVYLMVHYNHPRELTDKSMAVMKEARKRGLTVYNQTPMLNGVNAEVPTLVDLMQGLAENGITPYYLFHCRPTVGNEKFMMTLQDGIDIVTNVRSHLSGLARCFRYSGSHATGKIEIVGRSADQLVMKYHQARDPRDEGKMLFWPANEPIEWFDKVLANS